MIIFLHYYLIVINITTIMLYSLKKGVPYFLHDEGGAKFTRGIPDFLGYLVWGYQISWGAKKSVKTA